MLGDRQRKALRLIAEALLVLSEDPAESEAPPRADRPPRESTRAMVGRVRPTELEVAAARRALRGKGVPLEDETE